MTMQIHEVFVERIVTLDRQREDYGDIEGLKFSIEQYGLLQPIVVEPRPEGKYLLIAGGRRLTAFKALGRKTIPALFKDQLDDLTRKELEYEENIQRKDLTWMEEAKAIAEIHRIKKIQYSTNFPERFGRQWSQKDTAQALQMSEGKISQDCTLADALGVHPEIGTASNRKDALRLLRHLQSNCTPDESLYQKKLRDCFLNQDFMSDTGKINENSMDCIITDFTGKNFRLALAKLHDRLTYSGHGYIFHPLEELSKLHALLKEFNLPYRPRPYIWHIKGEDSYQTYTWFSRAQSEPPKAMPEHISVRRDKTNMHTLAKPYQVYYNIVINSTVRNMVVFDPFAYDTTLVRLCIDHARNVLVYCDNKILHDQGILNAK